ncbi:S-adenosyl-L-methionine-dependent methyltransferase [Immersiella caudata]|uniref:S-adenosyl-L-methionine-dependent methyltransferase n=1 Tax=Immersiella caudata TaxID=314043 RepID=A0AA39X264_9PEZI|nr:S-adenosyl-L-methionine-dependent methyltransferase [Immersiella caudata]
MVNAAFEQIKAFAATADDSDRRNLITSLRGLASSFEDPMEIIHRLGCGTLGSATVEIGLDLGLFKYLADAKSPLGVSQLAEQTGADAPLLTRIIRYLAATNVIDETGPGQFAANSVTKTLASDLGVAGVYHYLKTASPTHSVLPSFLKKTNYKNPSDDSHAPFQDAFNTGLHPYAWFSSHPENLKYFNDLMALRRKSNESWLSVYPVEEATKGWSADNAVYVNIGGSIGHQCAQFKETYPHVPGRVILQDLAHSIAQALPTAGVENMVHNFWDPQPVQGAKLYYMRAVLHNHPDHKVLKLLRLTKEAMGPDSILLIDEMILPETGVKADVTTLDLTMMSAFASAERTEKDWTALFEQAGLRLVKTYAYNKAQYESVMDVRLLEG